MLHQVALVGEVGEYGCKLSYRENGSPECQLTYGGCAGVAVLGHDFPALRCAMGDQPARSSAMVPPHQKYVQARPREWDEMIWALEDDLKTLAWRKRQTAT
jgi:hypothetical protein